MRFAPPLFLLLAGLVSACAEPPFIDDGISVTVEKTPNPVLQSGSFKICHANSTPWSEVQALADEQCASHGLTAVLTRSVRWQCRATAPHSSTFVCIDPQMRTEAGGYVNPMDKRAVTEWEKRTGKKAPAYGVTRGPVVTPPAPEEPPAVQPGPPAPPPAPISAAPAYAPPLSPADIAGKPTLPAQPYRLDTPPPLPLPAESGFKLPVGSWGDHFQE